MSTAPAKVRSHAQGWCPGALRPMESGDGLLVRVRPRAGALAVDDVLAIADCAERYGNGLIDLTRRANLQLRGLAPDRLPGLWDVLASRDLIDASAEAEAVRNVMVAPLARAEAAEVAHALEQGLADDRALWRLPGKFGFLIDDAQAVLPLAQERADIRLLLLHDGGVAIGCDRADGVAWLGVGPAATAARTALEVARAFLMFATGPRQRMRDLPSEFAGWMQHELADRLAPLPGAPASRPLAHRLGKIARGGQLIAAGIGAPFGRLPAGALRNFAATALKLGVTRLQLSPWRSIYAPVTDAGIADRLLAAASELGFVTDDGNPLMAIDACPGAPACRSSFIDTRAIASQLAPRLTSLGVRSCHVSGCAKGCARSRPADLVLAGTGEGIAVMRYDTAQGTPHLLVPTSRLAELPELLRTASR